MKTAANIVVTGVVQGVGFRYYALKEAQALGLTGYVRNRVDGSVESFVEGQREYVEVYISALEHGPRFSSVSHVNVSWQKCENKYMYFSIER